MDKYKQMKLLKWRIRGEVRTLLAVLDDLEYEELAKVCKDLHRINNNIGGGNGEKTA